MRGGVRLISSTSNKSVKQIVTGAGYADEASFRRAFKRFSGMTPGAYRLWARTRREPDGFGSVRPKG